MKRRHFFSAVAALAASPVIGKIPMATASVNTCTIGPEVVTFVGIDPYLDGVQLLGSWYGPVIGNCIDAPMDEA